MVSQVLVRSNAYSADPGMELPLLWIWTSEFEIASNCQRATPAAKLSPSILQVFGFSFCGI